MCFYRVQYRYNFILANYSTFLDNYQMLFKIIILHFKKSMYFIRYYSIFNKIKK